MLEEKNTERGLRERDVIRIKKIDLKWLNYSNIAIRGPNCNNLEQSDQWVQLHFFSKIEWKKIKMKLVFWFKSHD